VGVLNARLSSTRPTPVSVQFLKWLQMMKHLRKTFTSQALTPDERLSNLAAMEATLLQWVDSRVRETGTQPSGLVVGRCGLTL